MLFYPHLRKSYHTRPLRTPTGVPNQVRTKAGTSYCQQGVHHYNCCTSLGEAFPRRVSPNTLADLPHRV